MNVMPNPVIDPVIPRKVGSDLFKLGQLLKSGAIPDPFIFFILPCPPEQLITCLLPSQGKQFQASINELFEFSVPFELMLSDLQIFQMGDSFVLNSHIFSDQSFSIATVTGIGESARPGFGTITFNLEGVSVLPDQVAVPEPSSIVLMLLGAVGFALKRYGRKVAR